MQTIKEGNTKAFIFQDKNGDDRMIRDVMSNGNASITRETSKNFIKTLNKVYVKGKFEGKIKEVIVCCRQKD